MIVFLLIRVLVRYWNARYHPIADCYDLLYIAKDSHAHCTVREVLHSMCFWRILPSERS